MSFLGIFLLNIIHEKRGVPVNKKESLIRSFQQEVKRANQQTFLMYVDSFTNLWQYEFGTLDGLPKDIEQLIANRALELELME